jgi:geranylgeranyl pyrophosphate synthase
VTDVAASMPSASRAVVNMDIDVELAGERERVERALTRAVAALATELPPDVHAAAGHGVLSGGKRLRPVLCVCAYEACGGESAEALYDLAASIELVHAYSLMHDDLPCMDDAELRRGRPTTHRVHGEDATMRAGAALIAAAALQAWRASRSLGHTPDSARRITATLLQAAGAGGMVGGQWADLLAEGRTLGAEELDALHRRKTGALLAASLVIGGLAASASETVVDALREYGEAVGLAFQIADDILDATQAADTLGKNPSDAALGKSTYVALHGLQRAEARAQAEVGRAIGALERAAIRAPRLVALAEYVAARER